MTLGSMASNRYSAPFREDVNGWITKLSTVSEIVEQWLMVQSMWMYMEAVFSGGDIVKQLPQEAKRFLNIDKAFMKVWAPWSQAVTACCAAGYPLLFPVLLPDLPGYHCKQFCPNCGPGCTAILCYMFRTGLLYSMT